MALHFMKTTRTKHPYLCWEDLQTTPSMVKDIVQEKKEIEDVTEKLSRKRFDSLWLTGVGSSFNQLLTGLCIFRDIVKLPVTLIHSFDLVHYSLPPGLDENSVLIDVSQTGRTKAAVEAAELAKKRSVRVVAVTTVPDSPLAKAADYLIYIQAAAEDFPVIPFKQYIGALTIIYLFAIAMARRLRVRDTSRISALEFQLKGIPSILSRVLRNEQHLVDLAGKYENKDIFYFVGQGPNFGTAHESAVKIRECVRKKSVGISTEEIAHGAFNALDEESVVVVIAPPGGSYDRALALVKAIDVMGATTISVVDQSDSKVAEASDEVIKMPGKLPEILTPITYIAPLQLLIYHMAVEKGLNPDLIGTDEARSRKAWDILFPVGTH